MCRPAQARRARRQHARLCRTRGNLRLSGCKCGCVCSMRASLQATKARRAAVDADSRKLKRRKAHSAPGSVEDKPERKKRIVAELE